MFLLSPEKKCQGLLHLFAFDSEARTKGRDGIFQGLSILRIIYNKNFEMGIFFKQKIACRESTLPTVVLVRKLHTWAARKNTCY